MIVSSMGARDNIRNGKAIEPASRLILRRLRRKPVCNTSMTIGWLQPQSERQKLRVFGHGRKNNPRRPTVAPDKTFERFRRRGRRSGSVPHQTVIFRQQAGTRVAGSNTGIMSAGAKCAMKTSSTGSPSLPKRCQIFVGQLFVT